MEFTIPIVGTEIDTNDPGESLSNFSGAVLGLGGLAAAAGIATYGYDRIKELLGVSDDTTPVEGV